MPPIGSTGSSRKPKPALAVLKILRIKNRPVVMVSRYITRRIIEHLEFHSFFPHDTFHKCWRRSGTNSIKRLIAVKRGLCRICCELRIVGIRAFSFENEMLALATTLPYRCFRITQMIKHPHMNENINGLTDIRNSLIQIPSHGRNIRRTNFDDVCILLSPLNTENSAPKPRKYRTSRTKTCADLYNHFVSPENRIAIMAQNGSDSGSSPLRVLPFKVLRTVSRVILPSRNEKRL